MKDIKLYLQLMRLEKPAGFLLLMWPCWWGVILASQDINNISAKFSNNFHGIDLFLILLFTIGAIVVRGAGCVVNDIADRKIDALVERTKNRPLASGALSVKQAIGFLVILLLIGLVVFLQLNIVAQSLSIAAFAIAVFYPFTKRFFSLPQLVLGLAFNSGVLIGYAAVTGYLSISAWLVYFAGICWTLSYDTIYAHQDKKDDVNIGVNSTALFFGKHNKLLIASFFTLTTLLIFGGCLLELGYGKGNIMGIILIGCDFIYQMIRLNIDDEKSCLKFFKHNAYISGALISLAIMLFT